MLPFLKPKRQDAGIAISYRAPDDAAKKDESNEGLSAAADDLIKGIHTHDRNLVMAAWKAAFEILESMPHEEGSDSSQSEE